MATIDQAPHRSRPEDLPGASHGFENGTAFKYSHFSSFEEISVPSDEVGNALLDSGRGFVLELFDQIGHIGVSTGYIARL